MITFPIYTTSSGSNYMGVAVSSTADYLDYFVPGFRKYVVLRDSELKKKNASSLNLAVSDFIGVLKELFCSLSNQPFPKFRVFANEKTEEAVIEFAVAGYKKEDIDISIRNSVDYDQPQLFVKMNEQNEIGLSEDFKEIMGNLKRAKVVFGFYLPKYMEVKSATLNDGILRIYMKMNVPVEKKDIKIAIE